MVVPCPLAPMAPSLVRPPLHRHDWVYEEKHDGWRMLAYREGERVRLVSRKGVDHTARFPALAAAIGKLRSDVLVLDGEVVVFDAKLVSPLPSARRGIAAEVCTPPISMAFDVLQAGNRDVRGRPLEHRRIIAARA